MSAPCQACPTGTTTAVEGATSKEDCTREFALTEEAHTVNQTRQQSQGNDFVGAGLAGELP
jgi:hypothetical protein